MNQHTLSFIPENLCDYEKIKIIVTVKEDFGEYKVILPINSVNSHLFKPRFFQVNNTELLIVAPSIDVALQTREAILTYRAEHLDSATLCEISLENTELTTEIETITAHLEFKENVILGQFASAVEVLFAFIISEKLNSAKALEYLAFIRNAKLDNIKRVKTKAGNANIDTITTTLKKFLGETDTALVLGSVELLSQSTNPYFQTLNITYKGRKISIAQRPWGKQLSDLLAAKLETQGVKNLYFIGGCAGLDYSMEIDDLVIPLSCASKEFEGKAENIAQLPITASFFGVEIGKYLAPHTVDMYTVHSSLQNQGLLQKLYEARAGAAEMELASFVHKLKAVTHWPIMYIMDLPIKGIGLSDTYYNYDFLADMNSRALEGKNIAYLSAIQQILS